MKSGVFAPLRVANYRWLWIGQFVSMIGDKIHQIAMAMLVYTATGSMFQMGLMLGITLLPAALFGLLAGVYVDRWDRRRTMIWADLARAALVAMIPFVVRFGIGWVYVIAFIVSTVSLFFIPAKRASIPDLVPASELMAANSLDDTSEAVAEFAGLAVGAAIVAVLGSTAAFGIDAVSFIFSAIMISRISLRAAPAAEAVPTGVWAEAAEGLRHIWKTDVLRDLIGVYALAAVFAAGAIAVTYALALQRYDAGAPGVALLDAAVTAGTIVGALAVGRSGPTRPGRKFLLGIAAFGLSIAALALARDDLGGGAASRAVRSGQHVVRGSGDDHPADALGGPDARTRDGRIDQRQPHRDGRGRGRGRGAVGLGIPGVGDRRHRRGRRAGRRRGLRAGLAQKRLAARGLASGSGASNHSGTLPTTVRFRPEFFARYRA